MPAGPVFVTGAGGKTGRALIRHLAAAGVTAGGLVRRREQRDGLHALGAQSVTVGDMRQVGALAGAMAGARTVYHICPNVHRDELAIGRAVIDAARQAGVQRIVYHSVLHPQTEAMPHHWQKLRVEEALFESGLEFTILQPAPYMQNMLAGWPAITQQGVYSVPYAVSARLSLVDLEDVAAATTAVLIGAGHAGATYELVGTPPLTQIEVAAALSAGLGRPVEARADPRADWEARARANGLDGYAVETLLAMFDYYERFGLSGSPRVLAWLLGHTPSTVAAFARAALTNTPPEA